MRAVLECNISQSGTACMSKHLRNISSVAAKGMLQSFEVVCWCVSEHTTQFKPLLPRVPNELCDTGVHGTDDKFKDSESVALVLLHADNEL